VNIQELFIGTFDYDEEIIEATRLDRQPRVRVYQLPETVVVLGQGSKPEIELHLDACVEDNIPILQRQGGGCAVVIDPGNVIVSVVLPMNGIANNRRCFKRLSEWLAAGLTTIGISGIQHDGISDLVRDDRKVAGACIYCSKDLLYYSATLLVNPDIQLMERYLKHPPREPDYRRGRTHFEFVGGLNVSATSYKANRPANELRQALKTVDLLELNCSLEVVDS
jgi:lipoate-protein ligase A